MAQLSSAQRGLCIVIQADAGGGAENAGPENTGPENEGPNVRTRKWRT